MLITETFCSQAFVDAKQGWRYIGVGWGVISLVDCRSSANEEIPHISWNPKFDCSMY